MKNDQNHLNDRKLRGLLQRGLKAPLRDAAEPCPSPDLLAGYFNRELSGGMRRRVEDHMILCHACMKALDALRRAGPVEIESSESPRNWPLLEKAMDRRFYDRLKKIPAISKKRVSEEWGKSLLESLKETRRKIQVILFRPKSLIVAGSFAAVALVCVYTGAYFSRDRYFLLSRVKQEELPRMRAETTESIFNEGLRLYEQADYGKAIVRLSAAVDANPDHYAPRYYLGLSFLGGAEVKLPGLPYKFRKSDVKLGIGVLERALVLGGDNVFYQADCHWYLGKAYLMIQEVEKARAHWAQLVELGPSESERVNEARKLLSEIR
jgi:tetratricopeptide (TPR) repeat protein